ncbi:peptidase S8/S53 domain-containing protein [Xylaria scruposa]|nr:peptidase S8/S53 domain-containing protein [Xylaria scruposa]
MPPKNVCEAAQVANNHGFMLHIFVQEESFRYKCCDDEQPMYPTALPIMTISQLIECGFLNGLRRFNLKDRWILAVNLAQSLLQLHNGPWLQELWDSKTFTFLCENAEEGERLCNIHTPFVSCTISDSPPKLPKFGHFDRYPLLLTFGEFLLELALGEKLPIGMTNDGKFSPYKTLWNNFTEINTGSLSVEYKEAIKGCLEFHKFIKEETDPDVEVRIRMAIFKRIVQPLERNLRQFIKAAIPTGISTTSTSVTMPSLDALRPKDVYLNDRILFATPQGPSPESKNYHSLALECSNSEAAYVSQPGRDLLHTVKIPKKGHVLLQPPGEETIIQMGRHTSAAAIYQLPPSCDQKDNTDASLKLESKFGLDEAGDELFGSFNTEDSGTQGSTSLEWGRTFKSLSRIYSSRFQHTFSDEPVKVAVLDTGIDKTHPDFQRPRSKSQKGGIISPVEGEERQVERIKACQNFCGDREDVNDVTDVDGHGTHVAGIILQLAPKAELYIARVCQGDEDYGRNSLTSKVTAEKLKQSADVKKVLPDRVEWAIEWAIQHGVHLINMSFGYKKRNLKLDRAIKRARSCGIVIFAAASNFGNHEGVAWPANDPEIAICVHSSIDLGTCCSNFTPRADTETVNFMVVGEAVSSHWPVSKGGGFRKMSGTSTATPVATAIAALLLAFTKQNAVDEDIRNDIEHKVGPVKLEDLWKMRLLLKHICIKVGDYFWIRPGLLWNEYDPTETQQKDPSAATKHAWQKIGLALRR